MKGDDVIAFIESELRVPSGVGAGENFVLRPWQRAFIKKVYDPTDKEGRRVVSQAVFSVGRKNGKTALIATLVLSHLIGPCQEWNGEIYSAANERDQAAIVFKFVSQIIRMDPEIESILKIVDSTKTVVNYNNGTVYRALSAEAGSKHGLNPSVVIYDELGQAKNRELYDAMDTAMGAREQPLFFVISTQNPDPQHILSQLIDDGLSGLDPSIVAEVWTVPEDTEDIFDPDCWKLANPALGDFRLEKDFIKHAKRAKRMPSFEATFRNLYLNQRIDAQNPLIPRAEWVECKAESTLVPGEDIYLALDLSLTTDLSALVAVSAQDGERISAWFWKPKDVIGDHERRDRVPYSKWVAEGWLFAPPGRAVDYGYIAEKIGEIDSKFKILGIAYDRWRIETMLKEMDRAGLIFFVDKKDNEFEEGIRLVPWGQGFKDMAPAVDALEKSVISRKLKHDGNPVLTWNMSNAMVITDPAGNRKLDKSKSRFRIDGAVALTIAVGFKDRDMKKDDGPSIYETRGLQIL